MAPTSYLLRLGRDEFVNALIRSQLPLFRIRTGANVCLQHAEDIVHPPIA
jgi:hypothetical protein